MSTVRKSLYNRLPEIYHIKDKEQNPPYQLKAYLDILDKIQDGIQNNIETLYHDFFIETCSEWVIPYIADLLGTSHLSGDPWTLRADVARTIKHRRRKGTLGAIESLTYALTEWAVHTVELRERVVWNQHLNHQRPDKGGNPPIPLLIEMQESIDGAVRGGTVTLRDPALLSFFNGPFDPFAHVVDIKPVAGGAIRYNIPNLAIFLWRLKDFTVPVTEPVLYENTIIELSITPGTDEARFALRYDIHPLAEPMALFNTHRFQADDEPPNLTGKDAVPGPMPRARLSTAAPTDKPEESEEYVAIDYYSTALPDAPGDDAVGLTLHMPEATFSSKEWIIRGANLCAWETVLNPVLRKDEIVIDPEHGRMLIGVGGATSVQEADPLHEGLFVSATYGFSGSSRGTTGAHPIVRDEAPDGTVKIDYQTGPGGLPAANGAGLQEALNSASIVSSDPLIIEIGDSRIYELDISTITDAHDDENSLWVVNLGRSLAIRAASGQRPVIQLKMPLGFRPVDVNDRGVDNMNVTLEGLYITRDHDPAGPLINRAAVNQLTLKNCTLDPGNHAALDGLRQNERYAFNLTNGYGFTDSSDVEGFAQTPQLIIDRSICGPMAIDDGYSLTLKDSIIDAGSGANDTPANLALHAVTGDHEKEWGPDLAVSGLTCFGRMRVESVTGQGGIWIHRLEVNDDQQGCIKFSYFSGDGDKLPQHQACVFGTQVALSFVSEIFGQAGYAQLHLRSDRKILMQGPDSDAMGAFGYLLNTHKWKNINIRYREFMPVGVRPVLVSVT